MVSRASFRHARVEIPLIGEDPSGLSEEGSHVYGANGGQWAEQLPVFSCGEAGITECFTCSRTVVFVGRVPRPA